MTFEEISKLIMPILGGTKGGLPGMLVARLVEDILVRLIGLHGNDAEGAVHTLMQDVFNVIDQASDSIAKLKNDLMALNLHGKE